MKTLPQIPETLAASIGARAAFLTAHEQERMWHAAVTLADSRGLVLRFTALFGRRIEAVRQRIARSGAYVGGATWAQLIQRAEATVEDTLWHSYGLATFGLATAPAFALRHPRGNGAHRLLTAASGAASGFIGLPGILIDIPFTTTTILRSIAQVARDEGEDITTEETRRACLEVLAFGGPSAADDEMEIGYWATRLGSNHLSLNLLMKAAAGRFGLVLSEKLAAQAVPIAGAISGGALNYAFTEYYQNMAQVHFCLRALERRSGEAEAVRDCFATMLSAARDRRQILRKPERAGNYKYLLN